MVLDFGILSVRFFLELKQHKLDKRKMTRNFVCFVVQIFRCQMATKKTRYSWEISKNAKCKFVPLIDKVNKNKHASTVTHIKPIILSAQGEKPNNNGVSKDFQIEMFNVS